MKLNIIVQQTERAVMCILINTGLLAIQIINTHNTQHLSAIASITFSEVCATLALMWDQTRRDSFRTQHGSVSLRSPWPFLRFTGCLPWMSSTVYLEHPPQYLQFWRLSCLVIKIHQSHLDPCTCPFLVSTHQRESWLLMCCLIYPSLWQGSLVIR